MVRTGVSRAPDRRAGDDSGENALNADARHVAGHAQTPKFDCPSGGLRQRPDPVVRPDGRLRPDPMANPPYVFGRQSTRPSSFFFMVLTFSSMSFRRS